MKNSSYKTYLNSTYSAIPSFIEDKCFLSAYEEKTTSDNVTSEELALNIDNNSPNKEVLSIYDGTLILSYMQFIPTCFYTVYYYGRLLFPGFAAHFVGGLAEIPVRYILKSERCKFMPNFVSFIIVKLAHEGTESFISSSYSINFYNLGSLDLYGATVAIFEPITNEPIKTIFTGLFSYGIELLSQVAIDKFFYSKFSKDDLYCTVIKTSPQVDIAWIYASNDDLVGSKKTPNTLKISPRHKNSKAYHSNDDLVGYKITPNNHKISPRHKNSKAYPSNDDLVDSNFTPYNPKISPRSENFKAYPSKNDLVGFKYLLNNNNSPRACDLVCKHNHNIFSWDIFSLENAFKALASSLGSFAGGMLFDYVYENLYNTEEIEAIGATAIANEQV